MWDQALACPTIRNPGIYLTARWKPKSFLEAVRLPSGIDGGSLQSQGRRRSIQFSCIGYHRVSVTNRGSAPPYTPNVLALRFRNGSREWIADIKGDLTSWLPGEYSIDEDLALPRSMEKSPYEVAVGHMDPHYGEAEVRLAIDGVGSDGWYPLGALSTSRSGIHLAGSNQRRAATTGCPFPYRTRVCSCQTYSSADSSRSSVSDS